MNPTTDTPVPKLTEVEWRGINAALDEHDALCALNAKLTRQIEALQSYAQHKPTCGDVRNRRRCTCGLSKLLEEIKA